MRNTVNLQFGISFFVAFSAILQLSRDFSPVVTDGGNRSTGEKYRLEIL